MEKLIKTVSENDKLYEKLVQKMEDKFISNLKDVLAGTDMINFHIKFTTYDFRSDVYKTASPQSEIEFLETIINNEKALDYLCLSDFIPISKIENLILEFKETNSSDLYRKINDLSEQITLRLIDSIKEDVEILSKTLEHKGREAIIEKNLDLVKTLD